MTVETPSAEISESKSDILDKESKERLNRLKAELTILAEKLALSEVQKKAFEQPGGEQEIGKKMAELQIKMLPEIFKNVEFTSDYLKIHSTQKNKKSCQLACASNVFSALNLPEKSEEEISEAIGNKGETASVWPNQIKNYLESLGLRIQEIKNITEAIEALIEDEKIIMPMMAPKYPVSHDVLISGIKIDNGQIEFFVNDPSYRNHVETIQLQSIGDAIIPYSFHKINLPYSVSKA